MTTRVELLSDSHGKKGLVTVLDDQGKVVARDSGRFDQAIERRKVARRIARKLQQKAGELENQIERAWFDAVEQAEASDTEQANASEELDNFRGRPHYTQDVHGIVWHRIVGKAVVPTQVTNFQGRITQEIVLDDGAELRRFFGVEAILRGQARQFQVAADRFADMTWVERELGAEAIVFPGSGLRDHARCAIQVASGKVAQQRVFGHLGWRQIRDRWVYLHAGGALGRDGAVQDVLVDLPSTLSQFQLPGPAQGASLVAAIRASLELLELAPARTMFPLLAAVYRAPLGPWDASLHLAGKTGEGKTEIAALMQQHYGAGMDARHLPASWMSTGNSLAELTFLTKDTLLVVDDFCPSGTTADVQRYHKEGERLFRGLGNRAGRGRLRPDGTLRPVKPPRGFILSTGEDIPRGHSLRARLFVLEHGVGELDWERLTRCQELAADGIYAQVVSAYVCWLASRYDAVQKDLSAQIAELREQAAQGVQHRRTPDIVAHLAIGFGYFLELAQQVGALDQQAADAWRQRCWAALGEAAVTQFRHHAACDPAERFQELLLAALGSGRAHVADTDGGEPEHAEAWGWRRVTVGSGEFAGPRWQSQGDRIGWIDGVDLFVEPDAAYGLVQRLAREAGDALPVTLETLKQRLFERRMLGSVETGSATTRFVIRRVLEKRRRRVLHLRFSPIGADGGPCAPSAPNHGDSRRSKGGLWTTELPLPVHGRAETPQVPAPGGADGAHGPLGEGIPPTAVDDTTNWEVGEL